MPTIGLLPHLYLRQESSGAILQHIPADWHVLRALITGYKQDQLENSFKYSRPDLSDEQKFKEILTQIEKAIVSIQPLASAENIGLIIALYNLKSIVERNLNEYAAAITSCNAALKHLASSEDKLSKAIIYSNIAGIYNDQGKYAEGLQNSNIAYELVKASIAAEDKPDEITQKILGCIASVYGYCLRKTKTTDAEVKLAADVQSDAHRLYPGSNIILNNLAITLTKVPNALCQTDAIRLLEAQLAKDKQAGRVLFVTPYYLADAYIRLAFLQLGQEPNNLNRDLIGKATATLARAEDALKTVYKGDYQQKGLGRVIRLRGVICRLEGDKEAALIFAQDAKDRMMQVLKDLKKLRYFESKVSASIEAPEPTLFFNNLSRMSS